MVSYVYLEPGNSIFIVYRGRLSYKKLDLQFLSHNRIKAHNSVAGNTNATAKFRLSRPGFRPGTKPDWWAAIIAPIRPHSSVCCFFWTSIDSNRWMCFMASFQIGLSGLPGIHLGRFAFHCGLLRGYSNRVQFSGNFPYLTLTISVEMNTVVLWSRSSLKVPNVLVVLSSKDFCSSIWVGSEDLVRITMRFHLRSLYVPLFICILSTSALYVHNWFLPKRSL